MGMFQDSEFDKLSEEDVIELMLLYPINQTVRWYNYKRLKLPLGSFSNGQRGSKKKGTSSHKNCSIRGGSETIKLLSPKVLQRKVPKVPFPL